MHELEVKAKTLTARAIRRRPNCSTPADRRARLTKKRRVVAAARRLAEHYGTKVEVLKGKRET